MAIGPGGMIAIGAMALSNAKDWYAEVLRRAGLDPRVDPVTGSVEGVEWNGVLWYYSDFIRWDSPSQRNFSREQRCFAFKKNLFFPLLGKKQKKRN